MRTRKSSRATGIALLLAALKGLAFVVVLFALAHGDAQFYVAPAGYQLGRHDGPAVMLLGDQLVYFFTLGQKLAAAGLLVNVYRYAATAAYLGVDQPQLIILGGHVGAAQLAVPHAQGFGLGTCQLQAHN